MSETTPGVLFTISPVNSSRLVELEDGRLAVVEAALGVTRRWAVIPLEEERGREPTPDELHATRGLGGARQPATLNYYTPLKVEPA